MTHEQSSDFAALAPNFTERRKESPLHVMLTLVKKIDSNQVKLDEKLSRHMNDETDELAHAMAELLAKAFPEGDPLGHKAYHEASIRKAEDQAKFWHEMRLAASKWAGIGLLAFAATAIWTQFLKGPHS